MATPRKTLTYAKTPGFATTDGQDFEVALAALLFLRGLGSGLDFQLGTNVKGAGAMDDVVFRFKAKEAPCAWTTVFLQLKHKERKSVTQKLLLKDPNAGFLLSLYFKAYLEIQQGMSKEERNTLFEGSFEDSWFVLFTNAVAYTDLGDLGDERSGNLSPGENFVWSGTGSVFSFESVKKKSEILDCLSSVFSTESVKKDKLISDYLSKYGGTWKEERGKFLSRLRVFCGQPNVIELKNKIREELVKLDKGMSFGVDIGTLSENFSNNAKFWWEKSNDILCKDHDLLLRSVEKVRLDSASQQTQTEYVYKKLAFEEEALTPLKGILEGDSLLVCVESSERSLRLSVTKLMLAIGDQALVLTCTDLLAHKEALLLQWRNGAYKSLVVCADDQSLQQFEAYLEVVKDIVAARVTYRIVFLSNTIFEVLKLLTGAFQKSIASRKDDFLFSQLQKGSRWEVLAKGVNLQGRDTTLIEILGAPGEGSTDTVLGARATQEILSCEGGLSVGSVAGEGIDYYVDRALEQASVVRASLLQEGALRDNVTIRVVRFESAVDSPGKDRQKTMVSEFPEVSHVYVHIGLVKKVIHFLSAINDAPAIRYANAVEVVSKLGESPQVPDAGDGAVFVGRQVPLGLFQCSWVGLRFGQDDAVNALRVGSSKAGSQQACILFVSDEIIDEDARKLSDFHQSKHLLSLKDGKLRWLESHGDIEMIRPHIDGDQITRLVPEKATDVEERLVLVCAEPGMGKSTLMARLADNTKNALPHYFVISITLSEHSQLFDENKYKGAVDFLTRATKLESPVSQSLLKHALEVSGNAIVLLDGFDEIAPSYLDQCCDLLSLLLNTKAAKIWMTSRNSMKRKLESHFSKFSVKLRQFHKDDIKNFLKKFWSGTKNVALSQIEMDEFIDQLIEKISQAVRDKDKDKSLMGIPLQMKMLAEVYEGHVIGSAEKVALPASLDLLLLMEQFIDKKCRVYVVDKIKIPPYHPRYKDQYKDLKKKFMKSHANAALSLILGDKDLKSLDMEWVVQKSTKFCKKISKGRDNTGFIDGIVDNKPRFVHRVFAEFFVAQWISKHFAEHPKLVKTKLFGDDFAIVRNILDRTFARNLDLHNAVLREDLEEVKSLLEKESVEVEAKDVGGRTALHLAAGRGTSENREENVVRAKILELLLDKPSDIDGVDKVFGWSPSQYADATRSWVAIDRFLRLNVNKDRFPVTAEDTTHRGMLETIFDIDLDCLLSFCLDNGLAVEHRSEGASRLLLRACEKGSCEALKILIERNAIINQITEETHSASEAERIPLHLASEMGHVEIASILIGRYISCSAPGNSRCKEISEASIDKIPEASAFINVKDNNGITAIHAAATNGHSDVINLLIINGGDPLSIDDDNNTPLHLAAKYKHPGAVRVLLDAVSEADRAAAVNSCAKDGNSVLICGALGGCLDCVVVVVQAGGKMSCANKAGNTALLVAADNNYHDVVSYLLKTFNPEREGMSVADYINKKDETGWDVIHHAAMNGCTEDIMICQGNYNLEAGGVLRHTPLHLAAINDHPSTLNVFLESLKSLDDVKRDAVVNFADFHGETALMFAAEGGFEECVDLLVHAGAKLSQANAAKNTALITAASRGHLKVVKRLLTSFNAKSECMRNLDYIAMSGEGDMSALHRAALGDHSQVISELLSHGGDPLSLSGSESTPLHIAARNRSHNALRVLLDKLAEATRADVVNSCDSNGDSVLKCGVLGGCLRCVELLVEAGGNVNHVDSAGNSPLIKAIQQGNQDISSYLLDIFNAAKKDCNMNAIQNAIHIAALKGNIYVIKILIEHGGDPLGPDRDAITPLHLAAKHKHPGAVRVLLAAVREADRAAAVNSCDNDGQTVLHYAALGGCEDCVERLVQAGGRLSSADSAGKTPLMAAAERGHREVVAGLLLWPFNTATEGMSQQDYFNLMALDGKTAIHFAASEGHTEIVSFLFSQRGNPIGSARDTSTLLQLAVKSSHLSTVKVLIESMDDAGLAAAVNYCDNVGHSALYYATLGDCFESFELLVQAGGELSQVNCTGNTLLMAATESGNLEVVGYLLGNLTAERDGIGSLADYIHLADDDGNTAIHYAARGGHAVAIRSLIKHGGHTQTRNKRGSTALHTAAESRQPKAVNALLEALDEADRAAAVNSRDEDGNSVLICGARGGCCKCVRDLVSAGAKLSQANRAGTTPLMAALAAEFDQLKLIKLLLNNFNVAREGMSKREFINFADGEGCTVFHHGARHGVVADLFKDGDSQKRDHRNRTPLHLAAACAQSGSVDVLLRFLEEADRADAANSCDDAGDSALMCAARAGSADAVALLVRAGGKLSQANRVTLRTPLMEATANSHAAVAGFMLDAFDAERESLGKLAFIHLADKDGRTALTLANAECREVIEDCLRVLSAVE